MTRIGHRPLVRAVLAWAAVARDPKVSERERSKAYAAMWAAIERVTR